jgi:hypothetical protein
MLEAYSNERTPSDVLFDESPTILANKFYKTGPSPFFVVHERFFKHRHMMPGVILSNRPITSIQCKALEILFFHMSFFTMTHSNMLYKYNYFRKCWKPIQMKEHPQMFYLMSLPPY